MLKRVYANQKVTNTLIRLRVELQAPARLEILFGPEFKFGPGSNPVRLKLGPNFFGQSQRA